MDNTADVQRQIARLSRQIARTLAKAEEYKKKVATTARALQVRCAKCEEFSPLFTWTFIQGRYYVEPTGCTGGDYWLNSEMNVCHLRCPACGYYNYLYLREVLVKFIKNTKVPLQELFDAKIVTEDRP